MIGEPSAMATADESETRRGLRCMEIWGGSHAVDTSIETAGLDAWVFSQPYEQAERGGDVHYVSLCAGGLFTRLMVADVSGHGASVAEFSAQLRDLMRANINRKSQSHLVRDLNRQFAELAQMLRFATAIVATYRAGTDTLILSNAGHPRPLHYRAASGTWAVLSDRQEPDQGRSEGFANLPLGLDDGTAYPQFRVRLGQGDLLIFYTDALIVAMDPARRPLGEAGLLETARRIGPPTAPTEFGRALLDAITEFRGGAPADDDVTLLVVRHNGGSARRAGLAEKLDVYAKVFGLKSV